MKQKQKIFLPNLFFIALKKIIFFPITSKQNKQFCSKSLSFVFNSVFGVIGNLFSVFIIKSFVGIFSSVMLNTLQGEERNIGSGAVPCRSKSLFGCVLDGLGQDRLGSSETKRKVAFVVEQKATGIIDRTPVRIPLRTKLKSVDSFVPVKRGQRELIVGKTSIVLNVTINHQVVKKVMWTFVFLVILYLYFFCLLSLFKSKKEMSYGQRYQAQVREELKLSRQKRAERSAENKRRILAGFQKMREERILKEKIFKEKIKSQKEKGSNSIKVSFWNHSINFIYNKSKPMLDKLNSLKNLKKNHINKTFEILKKKLKEIEEYEGAFFVVGVLFGLILALLHNL